MRSRFIVDWARPLEALGEPPLSCASRAQGTEIYRVYAKPVLASAHWIYRLERTKNDVVLHVTESYPTSPDDMWAEKRKTVPVSSEGFRRFRSALEGARFWAQPTTYEPPEGEWLLSGLTDGETFLIEGMVRGRYHAIERSTTYEGPFEDIVGVIEDLRGPVEYVNRGYRW